MIKTLFYNQILYFVKQEMESSLHIHSQLNHSLPTLNLGKNYIRKVGKNKLHVVTIFSLIQYIYIYLNLIFFYNIRLIYKFQ